MALVIAGNAVGTLNRLVDGSEGDQSLTHRVVTAESRVLDESRFSRCQIAYGAVAKPAAIGLDVNALGSGKLRTRILNVAAVGVWGICDLVGVGDPPPVLPQRV